MQKRIILLLDGTWNDIDVGSMRHEHRANAGIDFQASR